MNNWITDAAGLLEIDADEARGLVGGAAAPNMTWSTAEPGSFRCMWD